MPIHPFVVHFVIALFPVSVLLDTLGWLIRNEKLHFAAWINLIGAGIGLIFAIISGLWEKSHIFITSESGRILEVHETLAFISACIIIPLALWRSGKKVIILKKCWPIYLLISFVGISTVLTGALYGGKLVYHHEIGIRVINRPRGTSTDPESPLHKPRDNSFYPSPDSTK